MEDKIYLIRKHMEYGTDCLGFCRTKEDAEDSCNRLSCREIEKSDSWFDYKEVDEFEF